MVDNANNANARASEKLNLINTTATESRSFYLPFASTLLILPLCLRLEKYYSNTNNG